MHQEEAFVLAVIAIVSTILVEKFDRKFKVSCLRFHYEDNIEHAAV